MAQHIINTSVLAFHRSLQEQSHLKDYAFGAIYPIIMDNRLLPFQVVVPGDIDSIKGILLVPMDGGENINLTSPMQEQGLRVEYHDAYTLLIYPGNLPFASITQEGFYYLRIAYDTGGLTGTKHLISDVFCIKRDLSSCIELTYSNPEPFISKDSRIIFSDGFVFRCYLPAEIGKPDYTFEETAVERMGYQFITSQVSQKVYRFVTVVPESVCDALRIVRLCADKTIKDKYREYELLTFNMSVSWQEQGNLAAVTCEFTTDQVIANIGNYKTVALGGDFNKDFNQDYYVGQH